MSDFLDRAGALFGPVTVSVDHSGTVCVWTVVWWLVHDEITSSAPIQRAAKMKGDRFEFGNSSTRDFGSQEFGISFRIFSELSRASFVLLFLILGVCAALSSMQRAGTRV
jgi:hypothetical protein